tara:strand:- start:724 stop:1698 length:975 start_codon:yes stop_codon:yes gene_type:complete
MRIPTYVRYDLSKYQKTCPVCGRLAKSNKCLADHIFHTNLKDQKHKDLVKKIREEREEKFIKKAKRTCPACNKVYLRCLATHLVYTKDKKHKQVLEKQTSFILKLFQEGNSLIDISKVKGVFMDEKWIRRHFYKIMGKEKVKKKCSEIHSRKRREIWASLTLKERKKRMEPVRKAEWGHLTPEQRKRHPWVIAGRLASLKSSKRGSKNQQFAFELINRKLSNFGWKYNYALDENWQIDIAAPKNRIYIEWDGRHHRVLIHGQPYLNNRINRDKQKDKIITQKLKGTLIRIKDDGRFNPEFVKERISKIIEFIQKNNLKNKVYYF